MTKRGLQLGGQFRYLFARRSGRGQRRVPADDRVTGTTATLMSWKHNQNLRRSCRGSSGYLNLNKVSDDTYFADLSDRVALTSQTTLPREGGLA